MGPGSRTNFARLAGALFVVLVALGGEAHASARSDPCEWSQFGGSPLHHGQACAAVPRELRLRASVTVDPFVEQERAESGGTLLVHYSAPILDDEGNVFVMRKAGQYVGCDPPGSGSPPPCGPAVDEQAWTERAYTWRHGKLVPRWTFISDWKPYPDAWEAAFQPAMSGRFIYLPGAGGTVFKVDKRTGRSVRRINPFGSTIDPLTWVAGGLAIDRRASLYFNVIRRVATPAGVDARSWLVRVSRRGDIGRVSYQRLIPGAPGATDLCHATFSAVAPVPPHPWPPPPGPDGSATLPPLVPCLAQRAAVNVTPALGRDGSIFTVTRAHNPSADYDAYVVAVRRDLTLKWATSLRGHLNDGCGVLVPYGPLFGCRLGAELGVDPTTNQPPAGQANDSGTSSPVVLPGGGVLYGAYTVYNGGRGHLMKFDRHGRYRGSYQFGWDITPAVDMHGRHYSLLVKDNFYSGEGPFTLGRLDANLEVQWRFPNPNGVEWSINAPAVDRNGAVLGVSEDGNLYAVDRRGRERDRVFLGRAGFAADTPVSIDNRGRVYAQNNGVLYVLTG